MNTEIGCIARANPYDVTLEEHMKANVAWYIWELMITHQWGTCMACFTRTGPSAIQQSSPRSSACSGTVTRT